MMWVSVPMLNEGYDLLSSDVEINIDVSREYRRSGEVDATQETTAVSIIPEKQSFRFIT